MEEKRTFSADELAILAANATPQERIERNALLPSEERLLRALSNAQTYLAGRYPREEFQFVGIDHSMPSGKTITLFAASSDTPEETFAIRVKGDQALCEVSESHFSDLKQAEVNELVRAAFARMGIEAACDLIIPGLYGDEYDPALSIESLISKGLEIPVTGRVLVMADSGADVEALRSEMMAVGLTGGFSLYAVQGTSLQEALAAPRMEKMTAGQLGYISLPVQRQEVQ